MAVLERTELEASPLADLHAIADQIGLEGFRRMRKADLVDAILGEAPAGESDDRASNDGASEGGDSADGDASSDRGSTGRPEREGRGGRLRRRRSRRDAADEGDADDQPEEDADAPRASGEAGGNGKARGGREAEGVVEVLGNGSAFLRVDPPEPSDDDVYISAAQVRRCELVSGDRVAGPVRTPRRSERYPSLVRVDTINGQPADSVSEGVRYEDLPVAWPQERIALGSEDPTLAAIE